MRMHRGFKSSDNASSSISPGPNSRQTISPASSGRRYNSNLSKTLTLPKEGSYKFHGSQDRRTHVVATKDL